MQGDGAQGPKKRDLQPHRQVAWVIPPDHDGEYVACMEDVLTVYERPYDPACPVVCMDEQPVQLIKETRQPIIAAAGRPARIDYEYERNGTAAIFMFTEPKAGWRRVAVRERRTKLDWAYEIRECLDGRYAGVPKVTLVMDNLNTHTTGSLYEAFPPTEARRISVPATISPVGMMSKIRPSRASPVHLLWQYSTAATEYELRSVSCHELRS